MKREHHTGHLPRLDKAHYKGAAFAHWTHTMQNRMTGWLTASFHGHFQLLLLHASARYDLLCPIYTLMPDHLHLLWCGIAPASDQLAATRFLRRQLADTCREASLQPQAHDHVLREDEREQGAFAGICHYIAENPICKELVNDWRAYPYTGCVLPGYPELDPRQEDYWLRFWRVYAYRRSQREAG